jgi:hypothetical protein
MNYLIGIVDGNGHSPINQNFELNKSRQKVSSQLERASQN